MSAKPSAQVGKYQLLERIAAGGMAEIFLARVNGPMAISQRVVVKRVLPELAAKPEFVQMFLDEARIVATLCHPNIVQMFDVVSEGGTYALVLEHVVGQDLRNVIVAALKQQVRVPLAVALHVVSGVAAGLHHAHERTDEHGASLAIVHRDVNPQNILVTVDGHVKLLDFGVAKANNRTHRSRVGVVKGKLSYMSPEQCLGQPLDHRSDLFSLGIVLFELIAGRKLFSGQQYDLFKQILERPIPRLASFVRDCPVELDRIVGKALSRDVTERYQTAEALRLDLERFARGAQLGLTSTSTSQLVAQLFPTPTRMPTDPTEVTVDYGDPTDTELSAADLVVEAAAVGPVASVALPGPLALGATAAPPSRRSAVVSTSRAIVAAAAGVAAFFVIVMPQTQPALSAPTPVASSPLATTLPPPSRMPVVVAPAVVVNRPRSTSAQGGLGTVQLTAELPVEIFINGVSRGSTPLALELPAGVHAVTVRNRDYAIDRTLPVRAVPQRTVQKHLTFETVDL